MKFKVRDGFVVELVNKIDLGNGTTEIQKNNVFAGQNIDVDGEVAEAHAHKLEPLDKAATAWLESKVLPVSAATQLGITPEQLALVQALASEIAARTAAPKTAA